MSIRLRAIALISVFVCWPSVRARSQELAYSDLERRIAALEDQSTTTEHLDNILYASDEDAQHELHHPLNAVVPCSCDSCTSPPREKFWYAGLELFFLNAHFNSNINTLSDDAGGGGMRFFVGREAASGFGWRTRLGAHIIESDIIDYNLGVTPLDLELTTSRFDFDLYRRFGAEQGSLLFGAGLSSGTIEFTTTDGALANIMENHGVGVSVFAEGRHTFYQTPAIAWSVLTRGRWAYLIGDTTRSTVPDVEFDSTLNTSEAAFGVEFSKQFRRTSFVVQYLMEAQSWETAQFDDVNFLGSSLRFGWNW